MKKNYSVNIGGRIFNIDDDAYARLNAYLDDLRSYFKQEEGATEIIYDIEMRIADLLQNKREAGTMAVTLQAIQSVITEIGSPAELGNNDEQESNPVLARQKLFRDPDHKLLGGVAAGIAAWLDIHPWIIRGLFILAGLFYFIGVAFYFFLWLIIPMAKTRSQKLEMSGKPLNIDSYSQLKRSEHNRQGNQPLNKLFGTMDDIIRSFFDKLWALLHFILIVLKKLSGLALILLVLGLVIGFGITALLREHYSFEGFRLMGVTFFDFFQWLVPGLAIRWQYYFASLLAMIGLGGLFISLGLRLLVDWPPLRWQVMSIFGLCILGGLLLGSYTTYELQSSRHDNQMDYSRQVYKIPVNKRLIINLVEKNHEDFVMESRTKDKHNFITATDMVLGQARLSIRPSETDSLTLVKMATASGKNGPEAQKYAAAYVHNLMLADSLFSFDQQYILSYEDGYHDHDLNYILSVPEGIKVYLNKNAYYTVPWADFKDHNGKEGWYQMTREGLLELPGKEVKDSIQ